MHDELCGKCTRVSNPIMNVCCYFCSSVSYSEQYKITQDNVVVVVVDDDH